MNILRKNLLPTFFFALTSLAMPQLQASSHQDDMSPKALQQRMQERRAVDAVIWGLPLVAQDAVKQAAFRDGKAKYNDIVWWPQGGSWKNQSPTPNVNTRYIYCFINTKKDGPVVMEVPPAVQGSSFYGTIEDAWYVPLQDLGLDGKGGKYLVLPPDYKGKVPDGYTPVRSETYNTFTLLRNILASEDQKDVQAGDDLVKKLRVYPLSQAGNPPRQRFLDMTDITYNGLVTFDETFFTSLSRMLNEEPVKPRDMEMMGMILPVGIEKGKEFKPDSATVTLLKGAATEAQAWLMESVTTGGTPWWPDTHWVFPSPPITLQTEFQWKMPDYFGVDARAIAFYQYFCPMVKAGGDSFYFGTFFDSKGQPLEGQNNYQLHVPANVPVKQFWSITIYSLETSSFFLNSTNLTLSSLDADLKKNSDGSVDIYIGPKPPNGKKSNWLYTPANQKWFPWFRVYGPEPAIMDKTNSTWKLPDIEKVN